MKGRDCLKYSSILFDLDQMLIIKKPDTTERIISLFCESGLSFEPEQVQRAFAQSEIWIAQQIMKENETGIRMEDDEFLDHIWAVYRDERRLQSGMKEKRLPIFRGECEQKYQLMPGVTETLQVLQAQNVTLGVVSNHRANIRSVLNQLGLTGFFSTIVISDEVRLWKPDPSIIRMALTSMDADGRPALYTGDHPFDILCAHQAGIHAAWMPPNPYYTVPEFIGRPEFEIRSLNELLSI